MLEVEQEFGIKLDPIFVETYGDLDQQTSLRHLDKTDFFTREVDALVLAGLADIAIHSAKDLPANIPSGLKCIAISKGVDPRDVLVLRPEEHLPQNGIVGSSSVRRDTAVKMLFPEVSCRDIRGTIESRLSQLFSGKFDGVVMAEAALIRLGLTHHNRIYLPGDTTPLQGRLAIIGRADFPLNFPSGC